MDKLSLSPDVVKAKAVLESYPRTRPRLSDKLQAMYVKEYRDNREGRNLAQALSQWFERWLHLKVKDDRHHQSILEIGGGTLNHLKYESTDAYDVIEPFTELYQGKSECGKVRQFFNDISEVPDTNHYPKILTVATLEHVTDLPMCIARAGRLLANDGQLSASIPSEGALLWGLGWRLTTGLAFRLRTGLDYGELMRHEHISTANDIIAVLRYFFTNLEIERFPTPVHHASAFTYIRATKPRLDRCDLFIAHRGLCS